MLVRPEISQCQSSTSGTGMASNPSECSAYDVLVWGAEVSLKVNHASLPPPRPVSGVLSHGITASRHD